MRKWNGWGDDTVKFPLSNSMKKFLSLHLGEGQPLKDATLQEVLEKVPPSRLPSHSLIETDPEVRVRHACGQSVPDWIAMRSGNFPSIPDGVAFPINSEQVKELLFWAEQHRINVIPYGGGTSVVGHLSFSDIEHPTLSLSLEKMNSLIDLDRESLLAKFGAGTRGIDLENSLLAHGYILGHYPQSFEYSTLGGWIAARSSGQQSLYYGRIERLYAGGKVETLQGTLDLPVFPASAAGPDVKDFVLGSEGRYGVITEAIVKIRPKPEYEEFRAYMFSNWEKAQEAVREIVRSNIPLSMIRLCNAKETEAQMLLAGHPMLVYLLNKWLKFRKVDAGKCLLFLGFTGSKELCELEKNKVSKIFKKLKPVSLGTSMGDKWKAKRFHVPYLRETLWEAGYVVDTLETACIWPKVNGMVFAIENALEQALRSINEKVYAFTHLSHLYPQGSSVYTTYIYRMGPTYQDTLNRWNQLKSAASRAIVKEGGTISHQHGVGKDHKPYLVSEKGDVGLGALESLGNYFDPQHIMSPGNLFETQE